MLLEYFKNGRISKKWLTDRAFIEGPRTLTKLFGLKKENKS